MATWTKLRITLSPIVGRQGKWTDLGRCQTGKPRSAGSLTSEHEQWEPKWGEIGSGAQRHPLHGPYHHQNPSTALHNCSTICPLPHGHIRNSHASLSPPQQLHRQHNHAVPTTASPGPDEWHRRSETKSGAELGTEPTMGQCHDTGKPRQDSEGPRGREPCLQRGARKEAGRRQRQSRCSVPRDKAHCLHCTQLENAGEEPCGNQARASLPPRPKSSGDR